MGQFVNSCYLVVVLLSSPLSLAAECHVDASQSHRDSASEVFGPIGSLLTGRIS